MEDHWVHSIYLHNGITAISLTDYNGCLQFFFFLLYQFLFKNMQQHYVLNNHYVYYNSVQIHLFTDI